MHTASYEFLINPIESAGGHQTLSTPVGSGDETIEAIFILHNLTYRFCMCSTFVAKVSKSAVTVWTDCAIDSSSDGDGQRARYNFHILEMKGPDNRIASFPLCCSLKLPRDDKSFINRYCILLLLIYGHCSLLCGNVNWSCGSMPVPSSDSSLSS